MCLPVINFTSRYYSARTVTCNKVNKINIRTHIFIVCMQGNDVILLGRICTKRFNTCPCDSHVTSISGRSWDIIYVIKIRYTCIQLHCCYLLQILFIFLEIPEQFQCIKLMPICTVCMYWYRKPLHSFINLPCYIVYFSLSDLCCNLPCRFLHAINLRVIYAQFTSFLNDQ